MASEGYDDCMMSDQKRQKWMRWCQEGAKIFSTCAKRQYMAVILDSHDRVLGLGYNGVPSGMRHCADGGCPRYLEDSPAGSNYDNCYSCHAEQNALLNSDSSAIRAGRSTLLVNGPPCFTCAKLITNSGVRTVYYLPDDSYAHFPVVAEFLIKAGVQIIGVGI